MCAQVQELVKQLQEDKSAVNMAKPGKAASTKQYAAQQSRARAAPALTLNVPHFEQQAKAATTAAKLTKANSVTAAPTVGRPAIAQQTTVHRAQWVVAGPALKAQKADNAVSMAASSDDDDKSCAACYIKGECIMLLPSDWDMRGNLTRQKYCTVACACVLKEHQLCDMLL